MRRAYGFTLVELMITVAVLAVLLSLAVPGFQSLVQNTRATTLANELTAAVTYARSEAVRRGAPVTLCPVGGDWAGGWFVVVAADCTGVASEDGLRRWDAPSPRSAIQVIGAQRVTFSPIGGRGSDPILFDVRSIGCVGERARELSIGPGGSVIVRRVECD